MISPIAGPEPISGQKLTVRMTFCLMLGSMVGGLAAIACGWQMFHWLAGPDSFGRWQISFTFLSIFTKAMGDIMKENVRRKRLEAYRATLDKSSAELHIQRGLGDNPSWCIWISWREHLGGFLGIVMFAIVS